MKNPLSILKPETSGKTGAFTRGFGSGAVSSGVMLGIFSGVSALINWGAVALGTAAVGTAVLPILGGWAIAATVLTTGIFSGVMGARKAASEPGHAQGHSATPAPVKTKSHGHAVALEQEVTTPAPRSTWTDRVASQGNAQSRIAQIRADGPSVNQTEALLAAREASAHSHSIG